MPNILVVNDDGIECPNIHFLAKTLMKYGNVVVCAPITEKSAQSHSINIHTYNETNIIVDSRYEYTAYMINGSPADCTRYACDFLNIKFDYVFSGVNNGYNLGLDIFYSGTVGAATEGVFRGIPSCALSSPYKDLNVCEKELENVLDYLFRNNLLSNEYVLNINFPRNLKSNELKWVKHSFSNAYSSIDNYNNSLTDYSLNKEGYITITPISCDRNNYKILEKMNK